MKGAFTMGAYKMGEIEMKFADIIWDNEPLSTRELVNLAEKELTWNRSTTYTILRRLSERGIFINNGGTVSSLITKDEFMAAQSEEYVEESFSGSLPKFLAAFAMRKTLSNKDLEEIQQFVDKYRN